MQLRQQLLAVKRFFGGNPRPGRAFKPFRVRQSGFKKAGLHNQRPGAFGVPARVSLPGLKKNGGNPVRLSFLQRTSLVGPRRAMVRTSCPVWLGDFFPDEAGFDKKILSIGIPPRKMKLASLAHDR